MFATPIHHAAIVVSSLEKSLYFYKDILGWKILFQHALSFPGIEEIMGIPCIEGKTIILQKDQDIVDGMIELLEITSPKPDLSERGGAFHKTGLGMLSFRVNDIEKTYRSLIKEGVEFISLPTKVNFGEYSLKSCMFLDPDGVYLEIIEFMGKAKEKELEI
jgi:catechol 2,3-dioxygenase-like lactoylglutathione lyase family enzyme